MRLLLLFLWSVRVVYGDGLYYHDVLSDPCVEQPRKLSSCGQRFQWFFFAKSKKCLQTLDDTCPGFNRFATKEECQYKCIDNKKEIVATSKGKAETTDMNIYDAQIDYDTGEYVDEDDEYDYEFVDAMEFDYENKHQPTTTKKPNNIRLMIIGNPIYKQSNNRKEEQYKQVTKTTTNKPKSDRLMIISNPNSKATVKNMKENQYQTENEEEYDDDYYDYTYDDSETNDESNDFGPDDYNPYDDYDSDENEYYDYREGSKRLIIPPSRPYLDDYYYEAIPFKRSHAKDEYYYTDDDDYDNDDYYY